MIGGGGNDRLADVHRADHFIGGLGNDTIISHNLVSNSLNDPDIVSGGPGFDRAPGGHVSAGGSAFQH